MQGEASQNVQLPMAGARRQFVLKVLDNRLVILVGAFPPTLIWTLAFAS